MRPPRDKKVASFRQRDEQLRLGRMAAPTLRSASPTATVVKVTLRFVAPTLPLHAEQSFALYPAARAYFVYPCPYGDCDGVFDVSEPAGRTLTREKSEVAGTLVCSGHRSRDGLAHQACGLRVAYTVSAQHESASGATPGRRASAERP